MPLVSLTARRRGNAVFGLCTLDATGRIADRTVLGALAWLPGERLDMRVSGGLIAIVADGRGVFRVSSQQFVHLPVAVRRWFDLAKGDRVLLAGYPEGGLLLVHPPGAVAEVVGQIHAQAWGVQP